VSLRAQRADLPHLRPVGDELALGAVHEILAEAVLACGERGSRRQPLLAGARIQLDQDVHPVGNRLLAEHPQDVAVEELEVAPGERVELSARVPEQLEEGEEQREVRPRVADGFLRRKFFRIAGIGRRGVQIFIRADEAAPVLLRVIPVLRTEVLELARVLAGEGEQVPGAALVDARVIRIELAQDAARLAGAVARQSDLGLLGGCHSGAKRPSP
jgi:hypothetical protein